MPHKTREALRKAWKGLTKKEKELIKSNASRIGFFGALESLLVGASVVFPSHILGTTIMATLAGIAVIADFGDAKDKKLAKKFSILFKKHRGKTLKQEHKRLQKQVAQRKLKKLA